MAIADKVLAVAASYLGLKGGDLIWEKLGLPGYKGKPWCCAFGDEVYDEAGFPIGKYLDCLSIQTGLIAAGAVKCSPKDLKPGGAVVYEFDCHGDSWDHFGICELNPGGYIQAIEGNVSDEVGRRTREYKYIRDCYNIDWQEPEKYTGWVWDANHEYCYHLTNGEYDSNSWFEGTFDWTGRWYYVGSKGYFVKNEWHQSKDGRWYYCGPEGYAVNNQWVKGQGKYAGKWYYLGKNGTPVKNKWVKGIDNKWRYLGADCAMLADCAQLIDGKFYHFKTDGSVQTSGTVAITFEAHSDGSLHIKGL